MIESEWSKKCFVVITNEVQPRANKLGISLKEFWDATVISFLARLEYEGRITRKDLRYILDLRVKEIQENDSV